MSSGHAPARILRNAVDIRAVLRGQNNRRRGPLVRFDETMPPAARMNIALHPMYHSQDAYTWICDNFLIDEHGAERLHAFPQEIVELG